MKAVIFDMDDTLYDQLEPFRRAFQEHFYLENVSVNEVFKLSRKYSDEVFELSESGEMSMDAMHIYRIRKALEHYDYKITDSEGLAFQKSYRGYQQTIELTAGMEAALEFCVKNQLTVGVITNGPKEYQAQKIQQLHLEKWIPKQHMIISGAVQLMKPDVKIFELAEKRMELEKEETYYVGDSFDNDIVGANRAGWKTIWQNRRGRVQPEGSIQSDFVIEEDEQLVPLLAELLSESFRK